MQEGTWINVPNILLQSEYDCPKQPVQRKESLQDDPDVKNTVTVNIVIVEDDVEPMNRQANSNSSIKPPGCLLTTPEKIR